MRLDHEALQDMIRFLLLTFRYFSHVFYFSIFYEDLNVVSEFVSSMLHTFVSYIAHQKAKLYIK